MRLFNCDLRQRKTFLPGTRRTRAPAETLQEFARFMPEVGITRLANVTGLDVIGIPVVQAIRPNARSLSVSQGKGVDLDAAKASAMMEAIELWHAERIEVPCRLASWQAMRRAENVADLAALPLLQGARIRPEEQRAWLRGWDLMAQEPVWVPFEIVSMNTIGVNQAVLTFLTTSNGLASGNHPLEAIEHALCEVIERDTHALDVVRASMGALPQKVDLETIEDPMLRSLIATCDAAEVEIAVFELDSGIGLPTFRVGLRERAGAASWRRLGTEWGCGTHLSPVVALSRALTEAAQARLTMIAGSRDDNPPEAYAATQGRWHRLDDVDVAFTAPPARAFSAHGPLPEAETFEGDLEVILEALRGAGIRQAVVVDLTKETLGIPVVKLIVPELEAAPFLPGYAEGRRARRARGEHA
jgi:ribosomal protein S12 methylthiotransferase accessory factor